MSCSAEHGFFYNLGARFLRESGFLPTFFYFFFCLPFTGAFHVFMKFSWTGFKS